MPKPTRSRATASPGAASSSTATRSPGKRSLSRIKSVEQPPQHLEVLPGETEPAKPLGAVPEHVQALFMQLGELAAERLNDILANDRAWHDMKPSDQRAFIELAFLRAYGAPVNRSLSVELSSDDADAVAASLAGMHSQLPEQRQRTLSKPPVRKGRK